MSFTYTDILDKNAITTAKTKEFIKGLFLKRPYKLTEVVFDEELGRYFVCEYDIRERIGWYEIMPSLVELNITRTDNSFKKEYINQEKINLEWQKYLLSIKGEKYYKKLLTWYRSWIAKLESQDKILNVNMPQTFAELGWQEGLADRRNESSEELSNWLEDCKKGEEIEPRIIQKINAFNNQKEIERLKANLLEIQKYYKSLNKSKFDKSAFMADLLGFDNADNTEVSC